MAEVNFINIVLKEFFYQPPVAYTAVVLGTCVKWFLNFDSKTLLKSIQQRQQQRKKKPSSRALLRNAKHKQTHKVLCVLCTMCIRQFHIFVNIQKLIHSVLVCFVFIFCYFMLVENPC